MLCSLCQGKPCGRTRKNPPEGGVKRPPGKIPPEGGVKRPPGKNPPEGEVKRPPGRTRKNPPKAGIHRPPGRLKKRPREPSQGLVQDKQTLSPLQDTSFHIPSPVSLEETISNSSNFLSSSSLNVQNPDLTAPESLNRSGDSGMMVQMFTEMDTLLDQHSEPEQLSEQGQMIVTKVESQSSAVDEAVGNILGSQTFCQVLGELLQLESMGQGEPSVLIPDQGSGTEPTMCLVAEPAGLVPEHMAEIDTYSMVSKMAPNPHRVFCGAQQWDQLLTLLSQHRKCIPHLEEELCGPCMNIITQLGLSENVMEIVDQMTGKQLLGLNTEVGRQLA